MWMKLLACTAALLAGCTTTPTPNAETSAGRLLATEFGLPSPNAGRLVVKRDTGFMGMGCGHRIYLNGSAVAELRAGEAVTLHVRPGDHTIGVVATGICDGNAETSLSIQANQSKTFRSGADQSGSLRIQPTAF